MPHSERHRWTNNEDGPWDRRMIGQEHRDVIQRLVTSSMCQSIPKKEFESRSDLDSTLEGVFKIYSIVIIVKLHKEQSCF